MCTGIRYSIIDETRQHKFNNADQGWLQDRGANDIGARSTRRARHRQVRERHQVDEHRCQSIGQRSGHTYPNGSTHGPAQHATNYDNQWDTFLFYTLALQIARNGFSNSLVASGAQGQQITLIPASALTLAAAQQGNVMRSVNIGGGMMQLQPSAVNANGFLQSLPVQNIPGLGNVQVIPASALQPTVQTLPTASSASPIVTAAAAAPATTLHLDGTDSKWQILQTIQPNGTIAATSTTPQLQQQHQIVQQNPISNESDSGKQHRRRIACTCPNCGDGDRCGFFYFFLCLFIIKIFTGSTHIPHRDRITKQGNRGA